MDVPGGDTSSAGTLCALPALLAGASEQQLGGTTSAYVNGGRGLRCTVRFEQFCQLIRARHLCVLVCCRRQGGCVR